MKKKKNITVKRIDNKNINKDEVALVFQEAILLTLSEKKLLNIEQYNSALKLLSIKK